MFKAQSFIKTSGSDWKKITGIGETQLEAMKNMTKPYDVDAELLLEMSNITLYDINYEFHNCESDGNIYLSNPPQLRCKICGKFFRE